MDQGWIKLHRKILDNIFLMHDEKAFMVFVKLLMLANRTTGEYATGRIKFAELLGINSNTLYNVLIRLENQHLINITSNNKYSVIYICNWKKYQSESTAPSTERQQRVNNKSTTNQHYNKKEEVERRIKNSTNVLVDLHKQGQPTYKTLFYELVTELGYSSTKVLLTAGRIAKLKQRLRSFSIEQLHDAAKGIRANAYLQGDNDSGKRYGTIDYLLRSDEQVAKQLEEPERTVIKKADW